MTSVVLSVEGMFSVLEALGVEKRLRKHRGVRRVEANFLSGTTTVVYEAAEVRLDEIVGMIHNCGYGCQGECLPEHLCVPAPRGGR